MGKQATTLKFDGPEAQELAKKHLDVASTDQKIDFIEIRYEYETDDMDGDSPSQSELGQKGSDDSPTVQSGAQSYAMVALQNIDEPATHDQIATKAKELGYRNKKASVRTELSKLARDGLISRERSGPNGSFLCWLTEQGEEALQEVEIPG